MSSRENFPDVQSSTMTALYSLANSTSLPVHVAFIPCIAIFFWPFHLMDQLIDFILQYLHKEYLKMKTITINIHNHASCHETEQLASLPYLPGRISLSLHVWLQTVYKDSLLLSDSIAFLLGDVPTIFHAAVTSYGVQQELRILACKQALCSLLYQNARSC